MLIDAITAALRYLKNESITNHPKVSARTTDKFFIAYSGGVDSHVLLQALATCCTPAQKKQLRVIHVHHGLNVKADQWAQHCASVCESLALEYEVISIHAHASKGESPEAAARKARYQVFAKFMTPETFLLTAHQQDDQAETLLLQLLRG